MSAPRGAPLVLSPPRAFGGALCAAQFKRSPEDFRVDELLGFSADGGEGHVLMLVEKRGLDTLTVLRRLARGAGLAPRDLGFAGLKDRWAVTRQWYTAPSRPRPAVDWRGLTETLADGSGYAVLEAAPHARKLKRGALKGNRFRIVLGGVTATPEDVAERLALIGARGVPNYFGAQRFGNQLSNLARVADWLDGEPLPRDREARGFVLSAARSLAFNAVLAARVGAGTWDRVLPGEFVNLDRSRSYFVATDIDATLEARVRDADVHPTGPLCGAGDAPGAEAGAVETAALAPYADLVAALEAAGLEAGRRALRVVPRDCVATLSGDELTVEFSLSAGAYATTVLAELVDLGEGALPEPEEEGG